MWLQLKNETQKYLKNTSIPLNNIRYCVERGYIMNKRQLNLFLNARLVIRLKDLGELKQFFDCCNNLNLKYDEEIVGNEFILSDEYIYAIYNYYTGCVCFYRARSSDFKESIKIINFDDIEPNTSNEVNKLISWIK